MRLPISGYISPFDLLRDVPRDASEVLDLARGGCWRGFVSKRVATATQGDVEHAATMLRAAADARKCWACGCLRHALDAIGRAGSAFLSDGG